MSPISPRVHLVQCPDCLGKALKTEWLPSIGYSLYLRQFRCLMCDLEIYIELATLMTRRTELELLKEARAIYGKTESHARQGTGQLP